MKKLLFAIVLVLGVACINIACTPENNTNEESSIENDTDPKKVCPPGQPNC